MLRLARNLLAATMWAAVAALAVGMTLLWAARRTPPAPPGPLPVLYDAPAFTLTDQNANSFDSAALTGKVWIADFIYTHCAGPCPVMTAKLVEMQKTLAPLGVRFVSFTVDPAADTPPQLKAYARQFGGDESTWSLLTGDQPRMLEFAKGMHLTVLPATPTSSIQHDTHFALIDAAGQVRGMYDSADPQRMTDLQADAANLAEEALSVDIHDLPAVNATLNGASGALLAVGYLMIKKRRIKAHASLMISAAILSTAFLACYLTYHYIAGEKTSGLKPSLLRTVYYWILFPHLVLAVAMLPMIATTFWRAAHRDWERHRRIARWTLPIWLYVSVTGVIIYVMLYHVFPGLKH